MFSAENVSQDYQTHYRLTLGTSKYNSKNIDLAKTTDGEFDYTFCVAFDDMQATKSENPNTFKKIFREQFLAILNDSIDLKYKRRIIIQFNPQNEVMVKEWVSANQDLLMNPRFKSMVYCIYKSDEVFTEKLAECVIECENKQLVRMADFRSIFPEWKKTYEFVKGLLTTDEQFSEKVKKDCERIATKNSSNLGEKEALERAMNTIVTENTVLLFMGAMTDLQNSTKKNVLLTTHKSFFSSYHWIQDKYAKDIGGLGHQPRSLLLATVKFESMGQPVLLKERAEKKGLRISSNIPIQNSPEKEHTLNGLVPTTPRPKPGSNESSPRKKSIGSPDLNNSPDITPSVSSDASPLNTSPPRSPEKKKRMTWKREKLLSNSTPDLLKRKLVGSETGEGEVISDEPVKRKLFELQTNEVSSDGRVKQNVVECPETNGSTANEIINLQAVCTLIITSAVKGLKDLPPAAFKEKFQSCAEVTADIYTTRVPSITQHGLNMFSPPNTQRVPQANGSKSKPQASVVEFSTFKPKVKNNAKGKSPAVVNLDVQQIQPRKNSNKLN